MKEITTTIVILYSIVIVIFCVALIKAYFKHNEQ